MYGLVKKKKNKVKIGAFKLKTYNPIFKSSCLNNNPFVVVEF